MSALALATNRGKGFHSRTTGRCGEASTGRTTSTGAALARPDTAMSMHATNPPLPLGIMDDSSILPRASPARMQESRALRGYSNLRARSRQGFARHLRHQEGHADPSGRLCAIRARMVRRVLIRFLRPVALLIVCVAPALAYGADDGAMEASAVADPVRDAETTDGFAVACDGGLCDTLGLGPAVPGTCALSMRPAGGPLGSPL